MIRSLSDLTAVLLCGGKGERLRPYIESLPKPLLPLHGHPILHHLLNYLHRAGIRRFRVCVGHQAQAIEEFVEGLRIPGIELRSVNSGDVSMTDRLIDAQVEGAAIVCYGDTLSNIDLGALLSEHGKRDALATLSVYPLHSPFGIVDFDPSGRITAFREKPVLPHWINIGYMILEKEALAFLRRGSDMVPFLETLRGTGRLHAYCHQGNHITVNTEKERRQAEDLMLDFFTLT